MGHRVGQRARRAPVDPRMLANENKGQAFKSSVDKKHYVSIDHPLDLLKKSSRKD